MNKETTYATLISWAYICLASLSSVFSGRTFTPLRDRERGNLCLDGHLHLEMFERIVNERYSTPDNLGFFTGILT